MADGGILPGTTSNVDPYSAYPIAGSTGIAQGVGAGQHGIVPFLGTGSIGHAVTTFWDWLNRPFSTPMSPVAIFGIVGSVIVAILLWNLILYHIRIAAEAI